MFPIAFAVTVSMGLVAGGPARNNAPRELGDVAWRRDLDQALSAARESGRPVLILFDEVPGCSTCVSYGETVLTHPLIVEAAEALFVPLAIYNNLGGRDADALKAFGEPSWNNPVVRIVDADRRPLSGRVNGEYTSAGLLAAMTEALAVKEQPVPEYVRILTDEARASRTGTERAVFAMYCFWSGEACLGGIDGIVATRTGFLEGREVVEVEFDPKRIRREGLLREASSRRCATHVFARSAEEARGAAAVFDRNVSRTDELVRGSTKDDKYNLAATAWRHVPMTSLQATRANAIVAKGNDPSGLFSPKQLRIFDAARQSPNAGWADCLGGSDLRALFSSAQDRMR